MCLSIITLTTQLLSATITRVNQCITITFTILNQVKRLTTAPIIPSIPLKTLVNLADVNPKITEATKTEKTKTAQRDQTKTTTVQGARTAHLLDHHMETQVLTEIEAREDQMSRRL